MQQLKKFGYLSYLSYSSPYFLVLNLLETKATQVPKFHFYTETIYNHKTESFGIYDLKNVSYLQKPKVRNSFRCAEN